MTAPAAIEEELWGRNTHLALGSAVIWQLATHVSTSRSTTHLFYWYADRPQREPFIVTLVDSKILHTEIEPTMSFFILIFIASSIVLGVGRIFRLSIDIRDSMRIGMALGFLFTGMDHFVNGESRYVPMIPDFLSDVALLLVIGTGVAEIAGAIGLLVPLSVYRKLGLPNLQRQAGIWLAVMLACVVLANINVAVNGQTVLGLEFGAWYFWLRPAFQPIFILWVLYSVSVFRPGHSESR